MKFEDVYALSEKFGPPKVDLRQAKILDSYGDESFATLPVNHNKPEDVTREEIDFYGWIYPFVEPEDLLFYLYAMVIEHCNDRSVDSLDSFMYSMDSNLAYLQEKLSSRDNATLESAFKIIWDAGGDEYADFAQCKNLQKLIDISIDN